MPHVFSRRIGKPWFVAIVALVVIVTNYINLNSVSQPKPKPKLEPKPEAKAEVLSLDERYHEHLQRLTQGCGDICLHDQVGSPSLYFDYISKPKFQCDALCTNAAIDAGSLESKSPSKIPDFMLPLFSYDGRVAMMQ